MGKPAGTPHVPFRPGAGGEVADCPAAPPVMPVNPLRFIFPAPMHYTEP